jgi:hypothetical protein
VADSGNVGPIKLNDANAAIRGKIEEACRKAAIRPPIICTPEELMGLAVMRRDPIVEDVRKHRAAIAREHSNDIDAIIAAFQQDDATGEIAPVSFPPKRFVKSPLRKARKIGRPNKALQSTSRAKGKVKSKPRSRAARGVPRR